MSNEVCIKCHQNEVYVAPNGHVGKLCPICTMKALNELMALPEQNTMRRPTIVCLCGSTRFKDAFTNAQLNETLAGNIVLTIGCNMKSDADIFGSMSPEQFRLTKARLDVLHFAKIDLADEILVLNVGGYIGESTEREIEYARMRGKPIRWLETFSPTLAKPVS